MANCPICGTELKFQNSVLMKLKSGEKFCRKCWKKKNELFGSKLPNKITLEEFKERIQDGNPSMKEEKKAKSWRISLKPAVGEKRSSESIKKELFVEIEKGGSIFEELGGGKYRYVRHPDTSTKGFEGQIMFEENKDILGIKVEGVSLSKGSATAANIFIRVCLGIGLLTMCPPLSVCVLAPGLHGTEETFNDVDKILKKIAQKDGLKVEV